MENNTLTTTKAFIAYLDVMSKLRAKHEAFPRDGFKVARNYFLPTKNKNTCEIAQALSECLVHDYNINCEVSVSPCNEEQFNIIPKNQDEKWFILVMNWKSDYSEIGFTYFEN